VRAPSLLLPLLLAAALPAAAQDAPRYPLQADVETIDGIVAAFYDVVSGSAGEAPDRARDESLHLGGARLGITAQRPGGRAELETMDLEGYHARYGGARPGPFYEREIHREVRRYGSLAQVWSTYEASASPGGPPMFRGVTSMQLFHDGERWWIAAWFDQRELPGHPLPGEAP
jgi:hypothetical protein